MRNILTILLFLICSMAYAQPDSLYTAKDMELKLESQKIELTKENIDDRITAQDKRIDDVDASLSHFMDFIAIGATIIAIIVGFAGFLMFKNNQKELRDARTDINAFKSETKEELKKIKDNADLVVKSAILEINSKIKEIESLSMKAQKHIVDIEDSANIAKDLVDRIANDRDEIDNEDIQQESRETVEYINENKPIAKYTFYDWFLKGYDAHENKLYEDATFYYSKAIEIKDKENVIDKDIAAAYNNWGLALFELAKLQDDENLYNVAIEKYEKATQLDENNANVYYNWGLILSNFAKQQDNKNQYNAAIEKFEKATQLDENNAAAYDSWGLLLFELAKKQNKLEEYKAEIEDKFIKACKIDNNKTYNLACLYSALNDKEKAFEYFKLTLQNPNSEHSREFIEKDTDFDNIRQDPRFEELLNKYRPIK